LLLKNRVRSPVELEGAPIVGDGMTPVKRQATNFSSPSNERRFQVSK